MVEGVFYNMSMLYRKMVHTMKSDKLLYRILILESSGL